MNILVISPHPDDEAIGCGGTICKHVADGDRVEVIFLTSGEKGGHGRPEEETIALRENESREATRILQVSFMELWKQPDGDCKAGKSNVSRLLKKIREYHPSLIYVTHDREDHNDHKAAAKIVKRAVSQLLKKKKPRVLMYEVWTPLQAMDHIVDISAFIDTKIKAIRAHKSQCDVLRFDEAILGLNRYREEMHSWPGGDYAEIFKEMKV